jgi:hypothetical protein
MDSVIQRGVPENYQKEVKKGLLYEGSTLEETLEIILLKAKGSITLDSE